MTLADEERCISPVANSRRRCKNRRHPGSEFCLDHPPTLKRRSRVRGGGVTQRPIEPGLGTQIEEAVRNAGPDGLTLQQIRETFPIAGKEKHAQALAYARARLDERRELRPNRAGRQQEQVVLVSNCPRGEGGVA